MNLTNAIDDIHLCAHVTHMDGGIGPLPAFRRHTMEFLITDIRTLKQTWVAGPTVREALIVHENAWRAQKLPASAKASVYTQGDMIDVSLGESACRGRRENVVRG